MGATSLTPFQNLIGADLDNSMNFILPENASADDIAKVLKEPGNYDQIIVGIHDMRRRPPAVLDFNNNMKLFVAELAKMNSIIAVFANPYTIAGLPGIEAVRTLIMNYQNTLETQKATAR